jgi:hypothetical protein
MAASAKVSTSDWTQAGVAAASVAAPRAVAHHGLPRSKDTPMRPMTIFFLIASVGIGFIVPPMDMFGGDAPADIGGMDTGELAAAAAATGLLTPEQMAALSAANIARPVVAPTTAGAPATAAPAAGAPRSAASGGIAVSDMGISDPGLVAQLERSLGRQADWVRCDVTDGSAAPCAGAGETLAVFRAKATGATFGVAVKGDVASLSLPSAVRGFFFTDRSGGKGYAFDGAGQPTDAGAIDVSAESAAALYYLKTALPVGYATNGRWRGGFTLTGGGSGESVPADAAWYRRPRT